MKSSVKAGFERGLAGYVHLSRLGIDGDTAAIASVVGDGGCSRVIGGCGKVAKLAVVLVYDLSNKGIDGYGNEEDDPRTIRFFAWWEGGREALTKRAHRRSQCAGHSTLR